MSDKDRKRQDAEQASQGLKREAAKDERKVEAEKGSHLKKGGERFEERAMSSDRRGK